MHTKPETSNSAVAAPITDEPRELGRGTVVDRFVVLETLGVGGMGVVYAAFDPDLDRKVALKLLLPRSGGSAGEDATRLVREGQALAKLSHPNVVAVHDVGMHGDRVWIAMEFVAGQTLAAWAKERPRRWSDVLAVLADVARGMAAAHGAGLIHRDLKPDNVMIGRDGRVRVMDFGLAHGRGATMTESELASTLVSGTNTPPEAKPLGSRLTAQGAVQGTPAYMAPEQWQGQEEEAATDQFGWSVMAWELLHGERPFAGATKVALEAAVLSGERRPPPRGHGVPGWLRRVIERGLATKPAGRWPTMAALLSALERGKARARVRMGVAALASVALLGAGAEGYRRWDIAQRVSVCEMRGAEIDKVWNDDVRQLLRDAFTATGVSYAETTAEKVMPWLDKQAGAWREARTEVCLNADVRRTWDEDLIYRAMWCLEDRQMDLESLAAELGRANGTVVQKAISAVAALRTVDECLDEGMLRRQPAPPAQGREAIRDVRAMLSRAQSLGFTGAFNAALTIATQARERATLLQWRPLLANTLALEGSLQEKTGAYEESETTSMAAYFEAASSGAWDVAARAAIDLVYTVGARREHHVEGSTWAQHAEVALVHAGDQVGLREAQRLNNLAAVRAALGEHGAARTLFQRALAIREQVLGPIHPDVAVSLNNLATIHYQTGAYAEARKLQERALAIKEQILSPTHPSVAMSLDNLANLHYATGEYAASRTLYERALIIREQALGPAHPEVAASLSNLADLSSATGAYEESRTLHERALIIREQALGPAHPEVAASLNNLANVHNDIGAYVKARTLYERALVIQEQALGPAHLKVATTLNNLANVHKATGAYADARILNERALAIREQALGPAHPYVATSLNNIANIHRATGAAAEARKLHERALSIREQALGSAHPDVAMSLNNLANLHSDIGEYSEALTLLNRALAIWEQALGPDHPNVATCLASLAQLYLAEKRPRDGISLLERAVTIFDAHEGAQPGEVEAHFSLARALAATHGNNTRAIAEAKKAQDGFREAGAGKAKELAEVDQWLAEHDRNPTEKRE